MKKILLSMLTISAVATLAFFGTKAYFSDSEVSAGNTFTAGAIDLKIDSTASYNGLVCAKDGGVYKWTNPNNIQFTDSYLLKMIGTACNSSWEWTDLNGGKFFSFGDVKPGDSGENTISMHIYNNDAYACFKVDGLTETGNDITEPESETGETVSTGNLGDNLYVMAWKDNGGNDPGDNIYQVGEDIIFGPAKAKDVLDNQKYTYADSTTGSPLLGSQNGENPYYLGISWCAGLMTVNPQGVINCDGVTMGNDSQTDSLQANLTFDVVQSRDNTNFECPGNIEVTTGTSLSVVDTDNKGGGQGREWFATSQNNNPNNAYEIELGLNDSQFANESTAWVAGISYPFTLSYDAGTGNATYIAGDKTVVYQVGPGNFSRIGINVKSPVSTLTTTVSGLVLSSGPLSVNNVSVNGGTKNLTISNVNLTSGFTLTGSFMFSQLGEFEADNPGVVFSID